LTGGIGDNPVGYQALPEFIYHNAGGTPQAKPAEAIGITCSNTGTPTLTCDTSGSTPLSPFGTLTAGDYATAYTISGCSA
jgi:hypothetical protein